MPVPTRKVWLKATHCLESTLYPSSNLPLHYLQGGKDQLLSKAVSKQLSSLTLNCLRADLCGLNTTISHLFINYLKITFSYDMYICDAFKIDYKLL